MYRMQSWIQYSRRAHITYAKSQETGGIEWQSDVDVQVSTESIGRPTTANSGTFTMIHKHRSFHFIVRVQLDRRQA